MSDKTTGVISGCEVSVDDGFRLYIAPGSISNSGAIVLTAATYLTLGSAPTTGVRMDGIWADLDDGTITSTVGTEAASAAAVLSTPATGATHLADVLIYEGSVTPSMIIDRRVYVEPPAGRVFFADYIDLASHSYATTGGSPYGSAVYLGAQNDPEENGLWQSYGPGDAWSYNPVQPDRKGDMLRAGTGVGAPEANIWIRTTDGMATTGLVDIMSTIMARQVLSTGTTAVPNLEYPTVAAALDAGWKGYGQWDGIVAGDWNDNPPTSIGDALNRIAGSLGPIG